MDGGIAGAHLQCEGARSKLDLDWVPERQSRNIFVPHEIPDISEPREEAIELESSIRGRDNLARGYQLAERDYSKHFYCLSRLECDPKESNKAFSSREDGLATHRYTAESISPAAEVSIAKASGINKARVTPRQNHQSAT